MRDEEMKTGRVAGGRRQETWNEVEEGGHTRERGGSMWAALGGPVTG